MQVFDSSLYSQTGRDFLANNLNYLVSKKGVGSLLVYSDLKGEGKTTFIENIVTNYSKLFKKRVLLVEVEDDCFDNLSEKLILTKNSDDFVSKTKFANIDFLKISQTDEASVIFDEVKSFYDLVVINSKNIIRDNRISALPKMNIDGALLIRSKKSLGKKNLYNTMMLQDKNIPIVGFVMNGESK